jgi:competence protein ComEC
MRFRSKYPFLWIGAGVVLGLILERVGWWGIGGIGFLGLGAWLFYKRKWADRGIWALALFALLGWIKAYVEGLPSPQDVRWLIGRVGYVEGYLLEEPVRTARAVRLLLKVQRFRFSQDTTMYSLTGKLLIYTKDTFALRWLPGQRLSAPLSIDSVRFGAAYWQSQAVYASAFAQTLTAGQVEAIYLMGYFYRWRLRIIQSLREQFPGGVSARALVEALLLGYKRGLDPETRAAFQLSGTAHILAVSGLHVGLVLTLSLFLVRRLLPPTADRKPIVLVPLMGLMGFYGFLTGASPSAMRAVIMGMIALLAKMLYQPYAALNALGTAAFVQLLLDGRLLENLGFQLSYGAVAGILAWYGPLRDSLHFIARLPRIGSYIKDLLAVSLAAQMGTLGLSWAYFGQFPLYFLIANLVAIPLATGLSYVGVLWLLLSWLPGISKILAWLTMFLAEGLLHSVRGLAQLPGGKVELPAIPVWAGFIISAATILLGFLYQRHKAQKVELVM